MNNILIVDSLPAIRKTLREVFLKMKYSVFQASTGKGALKLMREQEIHLVILDVKHLEGKEMEAFRIILEKYPLVSIAVMSTSDTVKTIIQLIESKKIFFLGKPFKGMRQIQTLVDRAFKGAKEDCNTISMRQVPPTDKNNMIGLSAIIKRLLRNAKKAARSNARILITGENGSGKELLAEFIHDKSRRRDGPFIAVNCAAIAEGLIESELFGHEKGAFTGAIKKSKGKFEEAHGGTLFLDEIGDISLAAQAKILRVLESGSFLRVGGNHLIEVDVRVLTATNKDIYTLSHGEAFRTDLYYRMDVINLVVPALNDRREDIPLLMDYFKNHFCEVYGFQNRTFHPDALAYLKTYNYRGNIRQLKNIMECLTVMGDEEINMQNIREWIRSDSSPPLDAPSHPKDTTDPDLSGFFNTLKEFVSWYNQQQQTNKKNGITFIHNNKEGNLPEE